ncbi:MAG: DUF3237 family protein [Actinomycetota bacterium]
MRLEPLYRQRFTYTDEWGVDVTGEGGTQSQFLFLAEGNVEGRITGRFRGANHPQRRTDGTFVPDFQGVIETGDGATIFVEAHGYGRAYPVGARQVVVAMTHLADDERYRWLNDVVCVGVGEVRTGDAGMEIVVEVAELLWEPID